MLEEEYNKQKEFYFQSRTMWENMLLSDKEYFEIRTKWHLVFSTYWLYDIPPSGIKKL